ncbi:unnamed protein product, partial [Rotaria socialis]
MNESVFEQLEPDQQKSWIQRGKDLEEKLEEIRLTIKKRNDSFIKKWMCSQSDNETLVRKMKMLESALNDFGDFLNVVLKTEDHKINKENNKYHQQQTSYLRSIHESLTGQATRQSDELETFIKAIKDEYLKHTRIQRLIDRKKFISMKESYIKLAIITTKEKAGKEDDKKTKNNEKHAQGQQASNKSDPHTMSTHEQIFGEKISIDVKDIFQECKDKVKKVVVLGRPGVGKSTFCQYVTYRWANQEIWSEYALVLLIRLRLLNAGTGIRGNMPFSDLLAKTHLGALRLNDRQREKFNNLCDQGRVLWMLDGYDEYSVDKSNKNNSLFDALLKNQSYIVTSRPMANISIPCETRLEITGFTDENKEKFIQNFFDTGAENSRISDTMVGKVLDDLRANPTIWSIAQIPVNLELICSLWQDQSISYSSLSTISDLYEKILTWLCRRYLIEQHDTAHENLRDSEVLAKCKTLLKIMESLAFEAMEANKIIITSELIEKSLDETRTTRSDLNKIVKLGLLQFYDDKSDESGGNKELQYYFVHLSFQEFFTARHMINNLNTDRCEAAIDFIKKHKYEQRFSLVFTFAAGLVSNSEYETTFSFKKPVKSVVTTFWNAIESEPVDIIGLRHIKLLMECIDEYGSFPPTNKPESSYIEEITSWLKFCLQKRPIIITEHLRSSFQRMRFLPNLDFVQKTLIHLYKKEDKYVQENTSLLMSSLHVSKPLPDYLATLVEAVKHNNKTVRLNACKALRNMDDISATDEVIGALIQVATLHDQDSNISQSSVEALSRIGRVANRADVANALINLTTHADKNVQKSACRGLVRISERAVTEDMFDALVKLIHYEDPDIANEVRARLKKMGCGSLNKNVMEAIVRTAEKCENGSFDETCTQLLDMELETAPGAIVDALLLDMHEKFSSVAHCSWEYFLETGQKVVDEYRIEELVKEGKGEEKRSKACGALLAMTDFPDTDRVIKQLCEAIEGSNITLSTIACGMLGKIGRRAAIKDLVRVFINATGEKPFSFTQVVQRDPIPITNEIDITSFFGTLVKSATETRTTISEIAFKRLGYMEKSRDMQDVIEALMKATAKDNTAVRCAAYEGLGKFAEATTIKNLIECLTRATEYSDKEYGIKKVIEDTTSQDSNIREKAKPTVSGQGDAPENEKILEILIQAADASDVAVNRIACQALGKISERAGAESMIRLVTNADGYGNWEKFTTDFRKVSAMMDGADTTKIIGVLVRALENADADVRQIACQAFKKLGERAAKAYVLKRLVKATKDQDFEVRRDACLALGNVFEGATTENMIEALTQATQDKTYIVRRGAYEALASLGHITGTENLIQIFLKEINNEDARVRQSACELLGKVDHRTTSEDVMTAIIKASQDPESAVRNAACKALGKTCAETGSEKVIKALLDATNEGSNSVRRTACEALAKVSKMPVSEQLMKLFEKLINDPDSLGRKTACKAVADKLQRPAVTSPIDRIKQYIAYPNSDFRRTVCEVICKQYDSNAIQNIVEVLTSAVNDRNHNVRYAICETFKILHKKVNREQVFEAITPLLGDSKMTIREAACELSKEMSQENDVILGLLINAAEHRSAVVRESVCKTLGMMDENYLNKQIIEVLAKATQDYTEQVRQASTHAFLKMDQKQSYNEMIPTLLELIKNLDNNVIRRGTCKVFGLLRKEVCRPDVIKALMSALYDKDWLVRKGARQTLVIMGETALDRKALEEIVEKLGDPNKNIRTFAWESVSKMCEETVNCTMIQVLVKAVKNEGKTPDARKCACEALSILGNKAATKYVIDALIQLACYGHPDLQDSACESLAQISNGDTTTNVVDSLLTALAQDEEKDEEKDEERPPTSPEKIMRLMCARFNSRMDITKFIAGLANDSYKVKQFACTALAIIAEKHELNKKVETLLIKELHHEQPEVRRSACTALASIAKNSTSSSYTQQQPKVTPMQEALLAAIEDEHHEVRSAACTGIGNTIKQGHPEIVTAALQKALQDKHNQVKIAACHACSSLPEDKIADHLMKTVVKCMEKGDLKVRKAASETITKIEKFASKNFLLNTLRRMLADVDEKISLLACSTIEKLSYRIRDDSIAIALAKKTTQTDDPRKENAFSALCAISFSSTHHDIIAVIQNQLTPESSSSRWSACIAAINLPNNSISSQIITNILKLPHSSTALELSCALYTLSKVSAKTANKEVIDRLINMMADEDSHITMNAREVLRSMGEKAANKEVIDALVHAMRDTQDVLLKRNACEVLG